MSNIISVVEISSRRSERLKDIVVENMIRPTDIVGCNETMQLFVADRGGGRHVIWRIDLKRGDQMISEFMQTQDYMPWTLSLSRGRRLIVTPWRDQSLLLYDVVDGRLLERIQLPGFMFPHHAIETKRGTFIVCHSGVRRSDEGEWIEDEDHDGVSEVDREGHVIRSFGGRRGKGQHQVNLGYDGHMAIDSVGQVLVADSGNDRILLLSEELKFDRILLHKKRGDFNSRPNRLYYDEQNKRSIVGLNDGDINIYEWK